MNPLVLTKISKFVLIGSVSAFISFIGQFQPQIRLFFLYIYSGTLLILLIAALWEGREHLTHQSTEEQLMNLLPNPVGNKSKREYLFSSSTRLELVVGIVTVTISALVGML